MICLIALIVFGIMGIFSVGYRKLAKEALDCVFRRITFRKCTSNLDERLKSQIVGRLMVKRPKLAEKVYKNFEVISWVFVIIFIMSFAYSAYSVYNLVVHGNCNGPNSSGFCIFNPQDTSCKECSGNCTSNIDCVKNCICEEGVCVGDVG